MSSDMDLQTQNGVENDACDRKYRFPWFLYFSGFTANLLLLTLGMCTIWTSPVLPKLISNDTNINPLGTPITTAQISIIASVGPLAPLLGLLIMATISDVIGRRRTMIGVATITACSLIVVAFANSIYVYYIFLFLNGLGLSGALLCVPVYNTEIAPDNSRGKVCCVMSLSVPAGILLGYIFGSFTSVRYFTLICAVPSLLHLLLSTVTLDSPTFLASKGNKLEALKALEKLRSFKTARDVEREYEKIQEFSKTARSMKRKTILDIFRKLAPRKAFLLAIEICTVQQLSGVFVMLSFMAPIFNEANSNLTGDQVAILVGLVQLSVFLVAVYTVDKLGRRRLLLFSSLFCACPMFLIGVYFYLKNVDPRVVDHVRWLPVMCVIVYFVAYGLGLGPVPIGLMGELFPNDLRAVGVASNLFIDNSMIFITAFSFPLVSSAVGVHYCFWFFSVSSVVGFFAIFFTLPETKGKSFAQIQNLLVK